jgi:hypothetical protein
MKEEDYEEKQIVDWKDIVVSQVKTEWDKGQQYVDRLNDLYDDLYDMLRGERPEKNYDWQSNIVINKVFQVIWTTVPYICQKVFGANPLMAVEGKERTDPAAHQRQDILEFWNTFHPGSPNHIPFYLTMVMWSLRAALNGVGILKKTWHQKLKTTTETRSTQIPKSISEDGKVIDFEEHKSQKKITEPVEDWPYNIIVNNRDIVCDWRLLPGQSIRQGRFVTHRDTTDYDALLNSDINYINLDELDPNATTTDSQMERDHNRLKAKDGLEDKPDSDIYTDIDIYERVGLYPIYKEKQDGEWVACFDKQAFLDGEATFKFMVITIAWDQNLLIRFEPSPYEEINYVDMHLYLDSERWQSMGQIEPIKDLQTAMSDNINAMFDEIWQNLMPPTVVNKYALWDWDTMQHAPAQKWLVGGNPNDAIKFKEPSDVTRDAWQKHVLFDNEIQLTSAVTTPLQGAAKEKAATTNIMNAQMSAGKLDFLVKMVEMTGLIPSAQMDVRFAKKFCHERTFLKILGQTFRYDEWDEEMYKYIPAASSVKLEHQKETEIQQDLQLMQVAASVPNPNSPKILNVLWANILRNRNMEKGAAMFDEDYFEPSSTSGNVQMLNRIMGSPPSNEKGIPMSGPEKGTRQLSYLRSNG